MGWCMTMLDPYAGIGVGKWNGWNVVKDGKGLVAGGNEEATV